MKLKIELTDEEWKTLCERYEYETGLKKKKEIKEGVETDIYNWLKETFSM